MSLLSYYLRDRVELHLHLAILDGDAPLAHDRVETLALVAGRRRVALPAARAPVVVQRLLQVLVVHVQVKIVFHVVTHAVAGRCGDCKPFTVVKALYPTVYSV